MKMPPDMSLWTWFKQKITPQGTPSPCRVLADPDVQYKLDLHGLTLEQAYTSTRAHIEMALAAGLKSCEIITGRSGQIRREFSFWMDGNKNVRGYEILNGGGAFEVTLVKSVR